MTPEFDNYISELLTESRCKGLTLRQLSDKSDYRFMRCVENPYSHGFKRIYWSDKRRKFDVKKCLRNPRKGTPAYETCKDIKRRMLRRLNRKNKS